LFRASFSLSSTERIRNQPETIQIAMSAVRKGASADLNQLAQHSMSAPPGEGWRALNHVAKQSVPKKFSVGCIQ
jgi:hypothetical protein